MSIEERSYIGRYLDSTVSWLQRTKDEHSRATDTLTPATIMSLVEIECEFRATRNGIQLSLIMRSIQLISGEIKVSYPNPSKPGIKAKEIYAHSFGHDLTPIFLRMNFS